MRCERYFMQNNDKIRLVFQKITLISWWKINLMKISQNAREPIKGLR
jgi:hypothetical protein